jgi:hypothetical protein
VKQHTDQPALEQLSLGLGMLGLCLGFLAAYGVLTGDADGQVNLLLLLLLFAFVPVVGLLLSILLMVKGGGNWIPFHITYGRQQIVFIHQK